MSLEESDALVQQLSRFVGHQTPPNTTTCPLLRPALAYEQGDISPTIRSPVSGGFPLRVPRHGIAMSYAVDKLVNSARTTPALTFTVVLPRAKQTIHVERRWHHKSTLKGNLLLFLVKLPLSSL